MLGLISYFTRFHAQLNWDLGHIDHAALHNSDISELDYASDVLVKDVIQKLVGSKKL